ncbi:MAG: DUF1501 domain-containing protein [Polyangiaceae bacterium]
MTRSNTPPTDRRAFLTQGASGLGALALSFLSSRSAPAADRVPAPHFAPKARRAIWLFMGGGPSQVDLFDYKPGLAQRFNEDLPPSVLSDQRLTGMTSGQSRLPIAPSRFSFAQSGQSGAWVSELLPFTQRIVDDIAIVKTVSTESINHDLAMSNINTGSQLPGKPSLGAWLSYGLGRIQDDMPTYVVMTSSFSTRAFVQAIPARLWGSSFLPASNGGVPMRGVGDPVLYLANPPGVSSGSRRAMLDALGQLNSISGSALADPAVDERTEQYELAFRMQSSMPGLTDLSGESSATLALYGQDVDTPGTFAANCVAARRMLERGVRFVQIYHRGWDAHLDTPANHSAQCRDIDQACYGLITDLKQRGLLEDTLVIWGGEFGRTVYCQDVLTRDNYGRDHHPRCFSMWLAGGGVRPGIVHGVTDDFSYNSLEGEIPLRDLHATILHLFGLDANRLTFPHAGLPERLTGVGAPAQVASELLL